MGTECAVRFKIAMLESSRLVLQAARLQQGRRNTRSDKCLNNNNKCPNVNVQTGYGDHEYKIEKAKLPAEAVWERNSTDGVDVYGVGVIHEQSEDEVAKKGIYPKLKPCGKSSSDEESFKNKSPELICGGVSTSNEQEELEEGYEMRRARRASMDRTAEAIKRPDKEVVIVNQAERKLPQHEKQDLISIQWPRVTKVKMGAETITTIEFQPSFPRNASDVSKGERGSRMVVK